MKKQVNTDKVHTRIANLVRKVHSDVSLPDNSFGSQSLNLDIKLQKKGQTEASKSNKFKEIDIT